MHHWTCFDSITPNVAQCHSIWPNLTLFKPFDPVWWFLSWNHISWPLLASSGLHWPPLASLVFGIIMCYSIMAIISTFLSNISSFCNDLAGMSYFSVLVLIVYFIFHSWNYKIWTKWPIVGQKIKILHKMTWTPISDQNAKNW